MGCRWIVSTVGYATSCCLKIKNKTKSFCKKTNDHLELYLRDDGNHSNIMSKEEINKMIEKNQQSASTIFNEYKLIKNTTESEDEDNNVYLIKQDVNTIEFDDKEEDHRNNAKELKHPNEAIEILKKEILMSTPEEEADDDT